MDAPADWGRQEFAPALPMRLSQLELSHRLPGLQIADVIANTFFNRAMVTERQARSAVARAAPVCSESPLRARISRNFERI